METITLYFRQGASDKVYQAVIEPQSNAYVVNFAYGRRGASLTAGTKTSQPVPLAQAKEIYNKLVSEKTAKGYTPGSDGTPYQGTEKASLSSGIHCQLLNALDAQELHGLRVCRTEFIVWAMSLASASRAAQWRSGSLAKNARWG